jgi:cobalt-factor III methyltransferase
MSPWLWPGFHLVKWSDRVNNERRPGGQLVVVGLGPGGLQHLTPAARQTIEDAEVIAGYKTYLQLIEPLLVGKTVVATGMRQEVARVREAIGLARQGKRVALVCSGDAGVYGMAGLVYEVLREQGPPEDAPVIEVLPGIPALSAAASLLGAPLMHDFAAISLSDLLTPWETIARRLEAAAAADFVIALYNPRGQRRIRPLAEAHRILLGHRSSETPVGVVSAAYRPAQRVVLTSLGQMLEAEIDMQTTIIVGNSSTFRYGPSMVTRRGYGDKYDLGDEAGD